MSHTQASGGERVQLGAVLPLQQPFLVQIFPVYACNFRCSYCIFALEPNERGFLTNEKWMSFPLYQKCIDDMKAFEKPLKMLRFAAIGEPLLHKDIAKMVAYAKEAGVAQSIEIVTNASLLTHALSDQLLAAGLDRLRISLEGMSGEDYQKNCGVSVDFAQLTDEIAYFYRNCTHTKVYVKIIDYMVQEAQKKQRFFDIFAPISHELAIEHLTPTIEGIDYDVISGGVALNKPQNEECMISTKICPQPFYLCQINPDGNVVPCCSMKYPALLGNVKEQSLADIWRAEQFDSLRRAMLDGVENATEVCRHCRLYLYGMHESDRLDDFVQKLKNKYKECHNG